MTSLSLAQRRSERNDMVQRLRPPRQTVVVKNERSICLSQKSTENPSNPTKALRSKVEKEYPGLSRNPRYGEWMRDAEHYMRLHDTRMKDPEMSPAALREVSREMSVLKTKADGWIHQSKEPRLFRYLKEAMTKSEGQERAREIKKSLSGAETFQDMERRLNNFYLRPELENLPGYKKHHENARSFYKMLKATEEGGLMRDIARETGAGRANVHRWMKGDLPRLPRIASEVPQEEPKSGHMWLPTKVEGKSFTGFIQVKEKVESFKDVKRVIDQLQPLETKQMIPLRERFGDVSKEEAFMYNLGIACSDGGFYRKSMTERFGLELGKKYDWSERIGEATRYHWGLLGVRSRRIADSTTEYEWNGETRKSERMAWTSEATPFVNWVKRSALGFEMKGSRSRIKADWMPEAPNKARTAFIQGIADGDGWVSSMRTGISSNTESKFYSDVLKSMGIHSKPRPDRVSIQRSQDIRDASDLPLFRHATGRQEKLERLADMYRASPNAGFMSEGEKNVIRNLSQEGLSSGEIRERIWSDMGISRSVVAIWRFRKQLQNNKPR